MSLMWYGRISTLILGVSPPLSTSGICSIYTIYHQHHLTPPQHTRILQFITNPPMLTETISLNFCDFLNPFLRKLTIFRYFPIPKRNIVKLVDIGTTVAVEELC